MDRDDLSLVFVSLGLAYPERPRFEDATLPQLYANLAARYPFEMFRYDRDSARLEQEAKRTLTVLRSVLIIEELLAQDIHVTKRDFADMVSEVKDHLDIPVFWEPRIVLRALWPVRESDSGTEEATTLMRRHVINLNDDQLQLLGVTEIDGITLNVEATDAQDDHTRHVHVEVGSYLRDHTRLYIEMTQTEHRQIETPNIVESWMQSSYDYFMQNIVGFADSITH